MKLRQRSSFSFVRTEGAILPADLLSRIQEGDPNLGGLCPEDYHLISGERLNEAISRSWNRLLGAWASFQTAFANLPPGDPAVGITREKLLLPLFDELHYGRLSPTKALEINGKTYPVSHGWRSVPIHLVGYGIKLDTRTAGVAGAARYSPHGMMQELLNRSDDHLWGLVSNGVLLRILRDNASLTRQAFVEFNLESIFDGEAYADFALLWLLCHQSRVEAERPEESWLERWSQIARTEGARALDRLRDGVEEALRSLGRGLIGHPSNHGLRESLRKGDLSSQDYYRQLLRLVYRLIFLFAAEDRNLLFPPDVPSEVRERYRRFYSTSRLRSLAARRRGTAHPDLYLGLMLVIRRLGDPEGCPQLGLPALGSFLWSEDATPDLDTCNIANHHLLAAVRQLAFSEESGVRIPIDYRNLGAEELGSVYEALLELTPETNLEAKTFTLKVVGGSERKTTGSYYTPSSLIQQLLDTALDPVIEDALSKPNPQEALLELKVCDPACGSGHFLVAAAHRIARRLASLRTGDEEPSPDAQRHALRDVIRHCIYGVDINPLAVELCKVNLWLETIDPGLPLSFLDHRIVCGNSLLGATPRLMASGIPDEAFNPIEGDDRSFASALKRQNRQERPVDDLQEQGIASGQFTMFDRLQVAGRDASQTLSLAASSLDAIEENTFDGVAAKQRAFHAIAGGQEYLRSKLLADAWCASFVWRKTANAPPAVTDSVFRRLSTEEKEMLDETVSEIRRLAESYRFLHWHLAFPGVFVVPTEHDSAENAHSGWSGGFDVVLGNPPWERVKLQEKEWFAGRNDDIADAPNKAERTRLIDSLREVSPDLYMAFFEEKRRAEGESQLVRNSGRYPLCGKGDVNTYSIFAELNRSLLSTMGGVGCIVPTGIATDDTTKFFFQDLVETRALSSLHSFENEEFIFPGIHHATKFCLLTLASPSRRSRQADFVFYARRVADLSEQDRHFGLSAEDIALVNPNTRTCPIFRTKHDAEITEGIYQRVPVLIRRGPPEENPWGLTIRRVFDMNKPSVLRLCEKDRPAPSDGKFSPMYEGKMIHQFDHRFGTYEGQTPAQANQGKLPEFSDDDHADKGKVVLPRYWVPSDELDGALVDGWSSQWLLCWRDITSAGLVRTIAAAIIPRVGTDFTLRIGFVESLHHLKVSGLLANLNTFVFDYCARQKVGGTHISDYIIEQLPTLSPSAYEKRLPWLQWEGTLIDWVTPRVAELVFTAEDLCVAGYELGYVGPPFIWNKERRQAILSELDAAFFHLYGIVRQDVEHIMDSFPLVRERDEHVFGEHRTKRVILETYDEMRRAIDTRVPYETRLDPPPADPRCCHPARV